MLGMLLWFAFSASTAQPAADPAPFEDIVLDEGGPRCVGSKGYFPEPPYGPVHTIRGLLTYSADGDGMRFRETSLPPPSPGRAGHYSDLHQAAESEADLVLGKMDYIASYLDWRRPGFRAAFAIEFEGQRQVFPRSYLATARACRPGYDVDGQVHQPLYRFTKITRMNRCPLDSPEECTLTGNHMILPEEASGPPREYSGLIMVAHRTPYFLAGPSTAFPSSSNPDRIPVVEGRWGLFHALEQAAVTVPRPAWTPQIGLFKVRFIGRRSPSFHGIYDSGGQPGKIVVDRLIAFTPCPHGNARCWPAE